MIVLITGALGHIGSALTEALLKKKKIKKIIILDNVSNNRYNSFINFTNRNKIIFFDENIINFNFNLIKNKINFCVHLAAHTNAEGSFEMKKKLKDNNYKATTKIVNFCKKKNIKLIFSSTTSVYGEQCSIINTFNKNQNINPQSPYADCKILEEKFINNNLKNFTILRFGTIVGLSEGIRFHTAVNKFCYQACLNKPLTVWKKLYEKKRPYLTLNDCIRSIIFVIETKIFFGETLNIVSENITVRSIISYIKKYINFKIKFTETKILNQLSYEVLSDDIISYGFKFRGKVDMQIKKIIKKIKL